MASVLKSEDVQAMHQVLLSLRARLQGDVDQMTTQALVGNSREGSGNLSSVPLHMADVGTENYDQEFTLSLIENDQETLTLIDRALVRIQSGTYGQCLDCGQMIAKARLQALPYASHCIQCARKQEGSA